MYNVKITQLWSLGGDTWLSTVELRQPHSFCASLPVCTTAITKLQLNCKPDACLSEFSQKSFPSPSLKISNTTFHGRTNTAQLLWWLAPVATSMIKTVGHTEQCSFVKLAWEHNLYITLSYLNSTKSALYKGIPSINLPGGFPVCLL